MRKAIDLVLLFCVVVAGGFVYLDFGPLVHKTHDLIYGPPCGKPETYSIGQLDPRFDLSQAQALAIIEKAADAWNTASGKDLFAYQPSGGEVTIDFTYDNRQQTTNALSSLDTNISAQHATYQSQKEAYDSMSAKLASMKAAVDAAQGSYTNELDAYNAEVESWNAKGGAPRSAYDELQAKQLQIAADRAALQQQVDAYNAYVPQVNAEADTVNAAAKNTNATVDAYNQTLNSSGLSEFKEGEYVYQDGIKEIDIYQFSSMHKLIDVVEHELGHSIGLAHVADPGAIMYPVNQNATGMPTAADLAELSRVCSE